MLVLYINVCRILQTRRKKLWDYYDGLAECMAEMQYHEYAVMMKERTIADAVAVVEDLQRQISQLNGQSSVAEAAKSMSVVIAPEVGCCKVNQ